MLVAMFAFGLEADDETPCHRFIAGWKRLRPRRRLNRLARTMGPSGGTGAQHLASLTQRSGAPLTITPASPDILGFVTKGGGASVHRTDCTNAKSLRSQAEKLLEVEWAPTGQSTFLDNIQVEALDRARLLSDITMVLSDAHVNILSADLSTTRPRRQEPVHLRDGGVQAPRHMLRAVRSVPGVFDAYRVTQ